MVADEVYGKLEVFMDQIHVDLELKSITNNSFIYPGKNFLIQSDLHGIGADVRKFGKIRHGRITITTYAIFRMILELMRNVVISFILFSRKTTIDSSKRIFLLTHFSSFSNENNDLYYGELPKFLNRSEVEIFRIFHGNLISYLRMKRKAPQVEVLEKSVSAIDILRIAKLNIRRSFLLLNKSEETYKSDRELAEYLMRAAVFQSSRKSYSDLILASTVLEKIRHHEPTHFVTLYEGHCHEIEILSSLASSYPNLKVFAYQHAPIVKAQLSFFLGIGYLIPKARFLVTGALVKGIITDTLKRELDTIVVLGSVKNFIGIPEGTLKEKGTKVRVLLAPEGDLPAVSELMSLVGRLAINNEPLKLTLRLHPNLHTSVATHEAKTLKKSEVNVSKNDLRYDLENADICVYRSSAVAIQGLMFGVPPLYLSTYSKRLFDPLDLLGVEFQACTKRMEENGYILKAEEHDALAQIGAKYFSQLKPELFAELMESNSS
jgi:hypothetical protein